MTPPRRRRATPPKAKTGRGERYGGAHKRERARWAPAVRAGQCNCCRCGEPIAPWAPWHLDHCDGVSATTASHPSIRPGQGYAGVSHAGCNIAASHKSSPRHVPEAARGRAEKPVRKRPSALDFFGPKRPSALDFFE